MPTATADPQNHTSVKTAGIIITIINININIMNDNNNNNQH
jgi:hypothetical protein